MIKSLLSGPRGQRGGVPPDPPMHMLCSLGACRVFLALQWKIEPKCGLGKKKNPVNIR